MRALLLAAGMGTRLRPITDTIPKCLVPIHGRPLLDYWLENLLSNGIEPILINTHYLAEKVETHVAASAWRSKIDLVFEASLLGTGGTILANRDWFGSEPFLVGHADNLTDFDVAELRTAHANRPAGCLMTMLAFRTDDPRSCGILELDSRGVVMAFHEKVADPPGNLANAAVYILEPSVIDIVAAHSKREIDLSTEVMPELVGRIIAVETNRYHRDIGTPESLRRANSEYKK
ncbi:mannose-1-phosphate guanylyltransferase [Pseudolabrys sp. Root1462]|uniref:nucleotidyltransferase family protein n=1 Tax=Pseudolabrys sp. Root1462 TaxID=1736466 RepID=UPI0007033279|nr:nucleotidyltransferase family protein [Pseudolabrys sp. Root1462]KQZ01903.1 mannose-1-phosphate guanylyltransferase [Pseudolabrys sp. Root1462]